jgi:nucleoside-diphosphate-sugar epimerase
MMRTVPPGQAHLDDAALRLLSGLTQSLLVARPGAAQEQARYLMISQRAICLPEAELRSQLHGATVLVTGGTGCIGSLLMRQLAARGTRRLVSVSRGVTGRGPLLSGAEYVRADIRDRPTLDRVVREISPDVVFHVAAQRNPGLAELEVHRTVTTNVLGTRNVLAAAVGAGVPRVVCASTGKALRPYSPDIYTASKRAAEWAALCAASSSEVLISGARFTHVVDNSIIYQRLLDWANGGVIRLHGSDIAFYAQSGWESAQLLLVAGLGGRPGEYRVHAITDLGMPVALLDLAVGVLARTGSAAPIYFSGYDQGYEEIPFPGLYDPATAGNVSPLLNAFETAAADRSPGPMIDSFRLEMASDPRPGAALAELEEVCRNTQDAGAVRAAQDKLSWSLLDVTLRAAPGPALARAAALVHPHSRGLGPEHRRMLAAIRRHADAARSCVAVRVSPRSVSPPGVGPPARPAGRRGSWLRREG